MGYFLLWLENLSLSLLFVATLLACIGRVRSERARLVLGVIVIVVPLLIYLGLISPAAAMELGPQGTKLGLFVPFLTLTICYLVGAVVLRWRAFRLTDDNPPIPAAHWPRGKLAIALATVFVLHVLTLINMDASAQQRMAGIRAEASTLALSVAPERIPDRDNAALIYYQAFEAMGSSRQWYEKWGGLVDRLSRRDEGDDKAIDPKDADIVKFLDANAGAILLLHEAVKRPACSFDRDYGRPSPDIALQELNYLRQAIFLLAEDARSKVVSGDHRGAIADVQTMFLVARHASAEPFLVGMLLAGALETQACETLEFVLNASSLSTDELARVEIDATLNYRRLLERAMRMEEALGLWMLCSVGGQVPIQHAMQMAQILGEQPISNVPHMGLDTFYRIALLNDDVAAYRQLLQRHRLSLTESYGEGRKRAEAFDRYLQTNRTGLLASMIVPALVKTEEVVARIEAQRRVALVGLASNRYRAKHGNLPEKLDDLTTDFLPVVPRDPFDGQPLRFKPTADGWIIYSIGQDLIDDGGKKSDSMNKGDVVFEIRKQKAE